MGKKLNTEDFIKRCSEIHNNKFDYSKTIYKNCRSGIIITCPSHGDIEISADNHLYQKQGCFNCFLDKHRLVALSSERLDNLKKLHNNKYLYDDLSVSKGFINIICPDHGLFTQYLYFHEYGHGCPQCNSSSNGENRIKSYLENNGILFNRNYIFDDCKNKRGLRFDFYLHELNTIIEYDGEHHFIENKYFGIGNLEYVRKNDEIKNQYCLNKNIRLIRIPYCDFDKIESILGRFI